MPRYLFGPVNKEFIDQNLDQARRTGDCLTFNFAGDANMAVGPQDNWGAIQARLPEGWQPDFIVLYLPYSSIPACLWSAPVPIIGFAADWNLLWHHYRSALGRCDLVLTDAAGVEVMHREGIAQARPAVLYGYGKDWMEDAGFENEDGQRDIDILFVGNLHPAVQRGRLKWLGRLASLRDHWNVQIHTGVFGGEYRKLLRRARIVFNLGIRGEANQRVFEAAAAGALLFQEQGNLEVPQFFKDREQCVCYCDDNLEDLLHYYLDHEEERRAIAQRGKVRAADYSFDKLWTQHLTLIQGEWEKVVQSADERVQAQHRDGSKTINSTNLLAYPSVLSLSERTWQALSGSVHGDPSLIDDLARALVEWPHDAELHNALGLATTSAEQGRGPLTSAAAHKALGYFQRAVENNPHHLMAGLNLVEALVGIDQKQVAVEQAKRVLQELLDVSRTESKAHNWQDAGHFPPTFDLFRVEWEKAAWSHAGNPAGEKKAKERLMRWRLHLLLAELTGDLHDYYEAVLARPDLPNSQAALGCALGRAGQLQSSSDHLHFAVEENPFDLEATRALQQVLNASQATDEFRRLARSRRRLSQTAPKAVHAEGWFMEAPPVGDELASIIISCCNQLQFTRQCLESVFLHTRKPYELILIDNGSSDGTGEYLEELKERRTESINVVRNETNLGYPAGCNQGIAQAQGQYLVFLNNDTIVTEGWLEGLIGWALHDWPKVGMVSPVTNYSRPPQQIPIEYQELDGLEIFAAKRRRMFAGKAVQTERLAGFCTMIRREVLDKIGGFDDRYGLGFFDDDDLCVRARQAGFQLLTALNVFVHHFGSRTFNSLGIDCRRQLQENLDLFRNKWGSELAAGYRLAESVVAESKQGSNLESTGNGLTAADHGQTKVSLCMIVKNEEENLPACLESARDLFDEIVVADTGSTDGTQDIARRYGAKVVEFPWIDSFAAARNESMRHASGDFIFWLDADDRLDPENRTKLKALLAGLNGENLAFSMKCLCAVAEAGDNNGAGLGTAVDHIRLFRNQPGIAWSYRVHEQILPSLRKTGVLVRAADVVIRHVGYQETAICLRKHERDLRLLQMDHAENPNDPFILFNLGWTFSEVKKPAEALPFLRHSLELSQPGDSITRKLFALIVQCQRQLRQPEEAVKVCLAGRQYFPDDAELLFQEALARNEHCDFSGAEKCLLRLIEGNDQTLFASMDVGLRTYKARHNLAVILQTQGRLAEAEAQWRHALIERPDYLPALLGLGELYLSQSRLADVETLINRLESIPSASTWPVVMRARLDMVRQDFASARQTLENAISSSPDETVLWIILSHALLQEGKDWERAEQTLRKVLELDPGNSEAQKNLATLLYQQGKAA